MDGWRGRLAEIMAGAEGRELTVEEVREAMKLMQPEDRLPALISVRQVIAERSEHAGGLSPHRQLRTALRA